MQTFVFLYVQETQTVAKFLILDFCRALINKSICQFKQAVTKNNITNTMQISENSSQEKDTTCNSNIPPETLSQTAKPAHGFTNKFPNKQNCLLIQKFVHKFSSLRPGLRRYGLENSVIEDSYSLFLEIFSMDKEGGKVTC